MENKLLMNEVDVLFSLRDSEFENKNISVGK